MTSFVEAARREKLAELVKRGVVPFAYRFDRTGPIAPPLEGFKDGDTTVHRLAGPARPRSKQRWLFCRTSRRNAPARCAPASSSIRRDTT